MTIKNEILARANRVAPRGKEEVGPDLLRRLDATLGDATRLLGQLHDMGIRTAIHARYGGPSASPRIELAGAERNGVAMEWKR